MRQRDAHCVVDLSRACKSWVEALPIQPLDNLKADFAWHVPIEVPAGETAGGTGADMYREGRRDIVKELLCMVVRENEP
jgi:hypothetical protein